RTSTAEALFVGHAPSRPTPGRLVAASVRVGDAPKAEPASRYCPPTNTAFRDGQHDLEGTIPCVEVVAGSEVAMITNMSLSPTTIVLVALGVIVVLVLLSRCINILRQYERGVVFRLGRALQPERGPGLVFIFWPIDRLVTISLRVVTWEVPPQDVIT